MAERRMFSKTIIDSDMFLDMPLSAQCLYFHLAMRADDDGFINSTSRVQRLIGSSNDDFKLLIAKQFIIPFETGVVVIKHWKIHNYIQKDRYKETIYLAEKSMLNQEESGMYTERIQDGYNVYAQTRQDKSSQELGESSQEKGQNPIALPSKEEKQKKSEDLRSNASDLFERLWKLYPKKEGKSSVSAKSKKALLSAGYDEIASCIDFYVRTKPDWQHLMNGSTFFNGRWKDYVTQYNDETTITPKGCEEDEHKPFAGCY